MTKLFTICSVLLLGPLALPSAAADSHTPIQILHLRDGSVIKGRIVGVRNNNYIIRSPTLGEVQVPMPDLASMSTATAGEPARPASSTGVTSSANGNIQGLMAKQMQMLRQYTQGGQSGAMPQGSMLNPQIYAQIKQLLSDPKIRQLLEDPQLQKDAFGMNTQGLQNNPNFQKLLQDPQVQQIIKQMSQQMLNQAGTTGSQGQSYRP